MMGDQWGMNTDINRSKCDANRDIVQASMGDPDSEEVYNEFHDLIKELQQNLSGRGLLVDVHGMVRDRGNKGSYWPWT